MCELLLQGPIIVAAKKESGQMRMWVTVIAVGIAVVGLGIPKADAVLALGRVNWSFR